MLREKCPNKEFFLVRILPHLYWTRRNTEHLSVLSPNAGKFKKTLKSYSFYKDSVIFANRMKINVIPEIYEQRFQSVPVMIACQKIIEDSEEATQKLLQGKVFWKYAANLQEDTHAEVWFR